MYLNLLKKCLLDDIYGSHNTQNGLPATRDEIENGLYWPTRAHTMIGLKRLQNIQDCFENVIKENIPGDLIETGVWRGGATIFMKGLVNYYNQNRLVFVADSFEGLPPPDAKYPDDNGDIHHTINYLAVDLDTVTDNFKRYDLLDDNVVFVKGFFETSLKKEPRIQKLAILRLDGDMYSSTIQVLDELYHKVSKGGYIIIDDYGLYGCRKAVTDFRNKHSIKEELIQIDSLSCYWKKNN